MKRKNNWKWVISLVVILMIIFPIAIGVHMNNEHDKLVEIAISEKANKVYRQGLKNIDKKAFTKDGIIKSYQVDKKDISKSPMGAIEVTLIVNKNKKMNVSFSLMSFDDGKTLEEGSESWSPFLDKKVKENNKNVY